MSSYHADRTAEVHWQGATGQYQELIDRTGTEILHLRSPDHMLLIAAISSVAWPQIHERDALIHLAKADQFEEMWN